MYVFVFLLEIIGTISFALSGAITGLQKNMDIFGVSILGLTTATGGGVIRDLLLGNYPPMAFRSPFYALTALGVSLLCFLPAVRKLLFKNKTVYNRLMLITDSAGLGLFAVIGVKIAMESSSKNNLFFTVFIGTVTAVGGGVLRDLMAGGVPFILMKHIYACAAIAGALVCALTWDICGSAISMTAGSSVVFTIRLLSAHYKWNLPKAKTTESL
ncbi:MAG: trimeric intracellular cation channel family protein [Eubacteriales bacterium]|nr:trimeric intracellular cation channel family protein [Eubacteriales bacterium]